MDRSLKWKSLVLVALSVLSALYLVPSLVSPTSLPSWYRAVFSNRLKLGLDLQGGLHIVYGIDTNKAVDDKAGEMRRDIEAKMAEAKIQATVETPRPNPGAGIPLGAILIKPTTDADKTKLGASFFDDYDTELETFDCPSAYATGWVCRRVASDYADRIRQSAIAQAIRTIKDRVDIYGVTEPTIIKKGEDIVVELPGTDDAEHERLRSIINRTAQLEFKIVDDGSEYMIKLGAQVRQDPAAQALGIEVDSDSWTHEDSGRRFEDIYLVAKDKKQLLTKEEAQTQGCWKRDSVLTNGKIECLVTGRSILMGYLAKLPVELQPDDTHQILFEEEPLRMNAGGRVADTLWRSYYVFRTAELTGAGVQSAIVTADPTTQRPEVVVTFNRPGARRFADLTTRNVGKKMAIILDERINSAPVIQGPIAGGRSNISMGGGDPRIVRQQAIDLKTVLETGSLPAPLAEKSSSKVGAMLGQDAVDKAQQSMLVGSVLIIALMIYFYRLSGVIAIVAMFLNILLQVAVLAGLQATLTLPGIAGLVLTLGMAVDSNIIIFERIRDELRSGKSVKGAVSAGFGRAFWAVFDAHVTNFIAGFVLMQYGTGPIRGFAVTLIIGVVCNLFTSTWVSRLMFDIWLSRKKATTATTLSI